jgi:hypothetical protein
MYQDYKIAYSEPGNKYDEGSESITESWRSF